MKNNEQNPLVGVELTTHITNTTEIVEEKAMQLLNFDDFITQRAADYIDCSKDSEYCPAVDRIGYLLKRYKSMHNMSTNPIYEVIMSIKYQIHHIMDDWHHVKNVHISNKVIHERFVNDLQINCVGNQSCVHFNRYQRNRSHDISMDPKNAILIDELDSIHAYIYHPSRSRLRNAFQNQHIHPSSYEYELKIEENKHISLEQKQSVTDNIWLNKPVSIAECNVDQIIYIINLPTILDKFDKLKPYKQQILVYLNQTDMNGTKLVEIGRKVFMTQAAAHLANKKLTIQFGQLFNAIIKFDVSKISDNLNKMHQPDSIADYNVSQIVFILETDIIDKLDKLKLRKSDIIDYFKENGFDGAKIANIKKKEFISELVKVLGNKKLTMQLATLYKRIKQYNVSFENEKPQTQDMNVENLIIDAVEQNNKFVTSGVNSQYAFGEQYRYTSNFCHHPLYIKPKYTSLKDELVNYFISAHKKEDELALIQKQMELIKSIDIKDVQQMSFKLVRSPNEDTQNIVNGFLRQISSDEHVIQTVNAVVILYYDDFQLLLPEMFSQQYDLCDVSYSDDHLLKIIKLETVNGCKIRDIMDRLFPHISHEFYTNYTLFQMFKLHFENMQIHMKHVLKTYFLRLFRKELKNITDHEQSIEAMKIAEEKNTHLDYNLLGFSEFITSGNVSRFRKTLLQELQELHEKLTALSNDLKESKNLVSSISISKDIMKTTDEIMFKITSTLKEVAGKELQLYIDGRTFSSVPWNSEHHELLEDMIHNIIINDQYDVMNNIDLVVDVFCQIGFSMQRFYEVNVQPNSVKYVSVLWSNDENPNIVGTKKWNELPAVCKADELREMFPVDTMDLMRLEQKVRCMFSNNICQILQLQTAAERNKSKFVEYKNLKRFDHFVQKAVIKSTTEHIKKLKAVWYHGINEFHQIYPNDSLSEKHIISLICYSSNSGLCTAFRETYRKSYADETQSEQKKKTSRVCSNG
eukprot:461371_1